MLEETIKSSGVIELMRESGALMTGHFELASGLHSGEYIQCALLLDDPARAEKVGRDLGGLLEETVAALAPQVVISPAVGGLIIGHEVAKKAGAGASCRDVGPLLARAIPFPSVVLRPKSTAGTAEEDHLPSCGIVGHAQRQAG